MVRIGIRRYGKMSLYLKILKLFQKKKIYDPYEIIQQTKNINSKIKQGQQEEKIWTPSKIKQEGDRTIQIIQ